MRIDVRVEFMDQLRNAQIKALEDKNIGEEEMIRTIKDYP
jgi:hypothetical protein